MFETAVVVFLVILFFGMSLVDKANDMCSFGDLFSGRAFSMRHQADHINREFDGFVICLTLAVGAFVVIMVVSAIGQAQIGEPKRVFLKDLERNSAPTHKTTHHNGGQHAKSSSTSASNSLRQLPLPIVIIRTIQQTPSIIPPNTAQSKLNTLLLKPASNSQSRGRPPATIADSIFHSV